MTEVLFYHLERSTLEKVLPEMLEKCLDRGWRAIVQTGSRERMEALDATLWTYDQSSFLPHATNSSDSPQNQPILLTTDIENHNGAEVRFLVDGAEIDNVSDYKRAVYMFDGNDVKSVENARTHWKKYNNLKYDITYWTQSDTGKWEKRG